MMLVEVVISIPVVVVVEVTLVVAISVTLVLVVAVVPVVIVIGRALVCAGAVIDAFVEVLKVDM